MGTNFFCSVRVRDGIAVTVCGYKINPLEDFYWGSYAKPSLVDYGSGTVFV